MIGDASYRQAIRAELLEFAMHSRTDDGFGNIGATQLLDDQPTQLYVTCRMTHIYSVALMAAELPVGRGPGPGRLAALAQHGVNTLLNGPLRDLEHGGWFDAVGRDNKGAYGHSFVLLAAASAAMADIPGAHQLLQAAAEIQLNWFYDEDEGLVVDDWDATWTRCDDYRGLNSNMHSVEAYLAVGDATEDSRWHERAARISSRVIEWARANNWRIPEHYSARWEPLLDYNIDEPAHPFRPYGATVGHALEWARLLLQVSRACGGREDFVEAAVALADRAVADGWAVDGAEGFVYTTDWDGEPVTRARMHWVLCEAIGASASLLDATGDAKYADQLETWWRYADRYLVDTEMGSWHHELNERNEPDGGTWPGKPDIYHAYQAALCQDVGLCTSFALAVRGGLRV